MGKKKSVTAELFSHLMFYEKCFSYLDNIIYQHDMQYRYK